MRTIITPNTDAFYAVRYRNLDVMQLDKTLSTHFTPLPLPHGNKEFVNEMKFKPSE